MANNSEPKARLVIGAQLRKGRELLQLTAGEVAQEIGATPHDIIIWEREESRPSLKHLEALAKLYGRGIDYFLRDTPAPPERIEFRGKVGQSLRNLSIQTKIVLPRFEELCRTSLELEALLKKKGEIRLPRSSESDSPWEAARRLRMEFQKPDGPLCDLRDRLEDMGVRIFELRVREDAFSGFSFWHSDYGPCILVNASEVKGRRNFTLAHELAHLTYGHGSSICHISLGIGEPLGPVEKKANRFAVELLLPRPGVEEHFRKKNLSRSPSQSELAEIAGKWCVSIQALGYRLETLGLILSGSTDKIVEARPKYFRPPKTPTWERRLGKRYVETAITAYKKGLISSGKLAQSLGLTARKTLDEIGKRTGQKA